MILAGDDAANEIINSEIERAIELEAKLNGENSRSSSSSNNNNNNNTNNEQQPEPPSIEQTIIRAYRVNNVFRFVVMEWFTILQNSVMMVIRWIMMGNKFL